MRSPTATEFAVESRAKRVEFRAEQVDPLPEFDDGREGGMADGFVRRPAPDRLNAPATRTDHST
ncbi:hypothetical protein HUG12_01035 [Halorarum salinum]|uniref:Uncharacterized protein n=1 Tax=Halorarum salinum TaxID=2743089 RepID=A0A7D5L8F5_9EURY|nr:hypothetical protein HUG12_01035 [Halobaculum salinum]